MARSFVDRSPSRRAVVFTAVAVLHGFAVYGLTTELGRKAIEVVKKTTVQVALVEEIKPTPPPTPVPTPIPVQKETPRPRVEPLPFVPPPEVVPRQLPAEPVISVVTPEPPPEPVVIAPPPP